MRQKKTEFVIKQDEYDVSKVFERWIDNCLKVVKVLAENFYVSFLSKVQI